MSTTALHLLLENAEQTRDAAAQALHAANLRAQAARVQHGELNGYRSDYQQRWTSSFSRATTMDIVGCYQDFGNRLNHAIASQGQVASQADQRQLQALEVLRQAEVRVAALRQLIQRRQAEAQRLAQRQDQRATDEFAARAHLRRSNDAQSA